MADEMAVSYHLLQVGGTPHHQSPAQSGQLQAVQHCRALQVEPALFRMGMQVTATMGVGTPTAV